MLSISLLIFVYFVARFARFWFFGKTDEDRRDSAVFMLGVLANALLGGGVDASGIPGVFLGAQIAIFVPTIVWDLRKRRQPTP